MKSIWEEEIETGSAGRKEYPMLQGDIKADVVVIGAGMAGILTAYELNRAGLKVVVLEAERAGSGQTAGTTAKVTSQHNLIYAKLSADMGEELACQYAHANQRAIIQYEEMISRLHLDCDFSKMPAYLYTLDSGQNEIKLEEEYLAAARYGIKVDLTTDTELPFQVRQALRFAEQAQFQPLKLLYGVAAGLDLYEHSPVTEVGKKFVRTEKGKVEADHIVMAVHYPFMNRPGYYFMRMHQERSYVLALSGAAKLDSAYLGVDEGGFSFRRHQDYLLFGGAGHRTGEAEEGGRYDILREAVRSYYPQAEERAFWSAQDCMTLDGVPYIGRFSDQMPNLYTATGFGKWGMTSSMISAQIIKDMVTGAENPYAQVFSPQRFHLKASFKTLVKDGWKAVEGIGLTSVTYPKINLEELEPGHGGIVDYDGEKLGVYKEEDGACHIVSSVCPHLGCQLAWNPDEKSWDCPCHGSRFDYKGNLISGPAMEGLNYV